MIPMSDDIAGDMIVRNNIYVAGVGLPDSMVLELPEGTIMLAVQRVRGPRQSVTVN